MGIDQDPSGDTPQRISAVPVSARGSFYVVGVGASAGGLEALEVFFDSAPADSGMAFVVVQHLSPDYKSLMVELLSKRTRMPVRRADEGVAVEPNTVYLIPPRKNLEIQNGQLRLTDKASHGSVSLPIDIFFRSLAEDQGDRAIGVILSGTGSDGMRGIRAIKEVGGLTLVQEPASARFDGMPRSAISTGLVDYISTPDLMPEQLVRYAQHLSVGRRGPPPAALDSAEEGMAAVLGVVLRQTGVDFTHYKPGTIVRRLERRMHVTQTSTLQDYLALLRGSAREVSTLYKEMLIGVTKFFRDPESFEQLSREVIAPLVSAAGIHDSLRVWVAGCSTGEEAFSIAILFHEQIEALGRGLDLKIFATDIDRDAIEFASAASYPDSISADVSPERLARFFVSKGDSYQVARSVRQSVIFAAHNMVKDAPFSRLDLVSCRNLFIYFDATLQQRALSLVHFALKPAGFVFLGGSEAITDMPDHFRAIDGKSRIFQRIGSLRAPMIDLGSHGPLRARATGPHAVEVIEPPKGSAIAVERAMSDMVEEFAPAALLVSESHQLVHVFGDASKFLIIPRGTASFNVLDMLPKPMASIVALGVPKALRDGAPLRYRGIQAELPEGPRLVGLRIKPLGAPALRGRYVLLQLDASERKPTLGDEPSAELPVDQGARLGELQAELQFTQENLQATIEELETSNEELQATNEELVASNEEMQSTNEELQSVNEELLTVNSEYQAKISELTELNADVENLLRSASIATVFLDRDLNIRRFTPDAVALVNVMARDIGRPIEHISVNFDGDGFVEQLRAVVVTRTMRERTADTPDGRHYLIRMLPYLVDGAASNGAVITFVDVTAAREAEWRQQRILDSLVEQIAVLDRDGIIRLVNEAWTRFASENGGDPAKSGVGQSYLAVCRETEPDDDRIGDSIAAGVADVLAGRRATFSTEYACDSPDERRWFVMNVGRLSNGGGVVVSHMNVTRQHVAEAAAAAASTSTGPASAEPKEIHHER